MSEFFNKMMYGDGDKKDFSPKDLPRTRAQVYKRLIRTQWGKLLVANWWTLLFCLPLLAWNMLCLSYGARFDLTTADGTQAYIRFCLQCVIRCRYVSALSPLSGLRALPTPCAT